MLRLISFLALGATCVFLIASQAPVVQAGYPATQSGGGHWTTMVAADSVCDTLRAPDNMLIDEVVLYHTAGQSGKDTLRLISATHCDSILGTHVMLDSINIVSGNQTYQFSWPTRASKVYVRGVSTVGAWGWTAGFVPCKYREDDCGCDDVAAPVAAKPIWGDQ